MILKIRLILKILLILSIIVFIDFFGIGVARSWAAAACRTVDRGLVLWDAGLASFSAA